MYSAYNSTSIGASHTYNGRVCQDWSGSVNNERYKLAVVSDGHGGGDFFRSDRGSRFAVDVFCKCADEAFGSETGSCAGLSECEDDEKIYELLKSFMSKVVAGWNEVVENDLAVSPFTEEEMANVTDHARASYEKGEDLHSAYGATLIGAVITADYWFGIHIGDGKCVVFGNDGEVTEPIPWDAMCYNNITTSICSPSAVSEFRYYFSRELPAAVFLCTDGIDGSFASSRYHHDFYRLVLSTFASETEERACLELEEYLPELSAQGSGDDMSIAYFIDVDEIVSEPELFKRKKLPYLRILRVGNFGASNPSDDYTQKGEIEAYVGTVRLDLLGLWGFREGVMEFEITSVSDDRVTISVSGTEYNVTPAERAEITFRETVNGSSEYDTLFIYFMMK